MPTLLDITEDLLDLEARLEALGGDTEAAEGLVDDWLAAMDREKEKLDNYAGLIRDLELRAEARKAEADRMKERARIDANRADFLKERLRQHFAARGMKTVETARFRLTLAKHGGRLPIEVHVSPDVLPEAYRKARIQYSADYDEIRDTLDRTGEIRDASGRLVAAYGERGSSIRIR